MIQLLELLPSNGLFQIVRVDQTVQQKRQHAPHCSVPYGLHKSMMDNVLILMDRQEKATCIERSALHKLHRHAQLHTQCGD